MAKRSSVTAYDQFLRNHKVLARATDSILEGIAEFSHIADAAGLRETVSAIRAAQASASKPDTTIRERVERRLFASKLGRDDIRLFSLACRAAEVTLGISPWHHQIMTALLLNRGLVVQLPNGSGKTLAIALAAAFSALSGGSSHIATYNDYLAERDTRWMGKFYQSLGLSVGVVFTGQSVRFEHGLLDEDGLTLVVAPKFGSAQSGGTEASENDQPQFPTDSTEQDGAVLPLEYVESIAKHWQAIQGLRQRLELELSSEGSLKSQALAMARFVVDGLVARRCPDDTASDDWDLTSLREDISTHFGLDSGSLFVGVTNHQDLVNHLMASITTRYEEKENLIGSELLGKVEHQIFIQVIDGRWNEHQKLLRELASEIAPQDASGLYGFRKRSEELFESLKLRIASDAIRYLFFLRVEHSEAPAGSEPEVNDDANSGTGEQQKELPLNEELAAETATQPPILPSPQPALQTADQLIHDTNLTYVKDPTLDLARVLACDIVYSRIEGFAFAYLKDNLATSENDLKLTRHDFLLVDECDSSLLDDLQLSIQIMRTTPTRSLPIHVLYWLQRIAQQLRPGRDFTVEGKSVRLTFEGLNTLRIVGGRDFFSSSESGLAPGIVNALHAEYAYKRDEDYVCMGNELVIVESKSGRLLYGRNFGGGLQEALRVKEGLSVGELWANERVATITAKHFVRVYTKVAGTSGAIGDPSEYWELYGLEAVALDPYPKTRRDHPDLVYRTSRETVKFGVVPKAVEASKRGQPVLINVPKLSDIPVVADELKSSGVPFQVLDALAVRTQGEEAEKIQRAGSPGLVTLSSKLAARGTDIVLDPAALKAGGLFVIGLQRETNRRFDDQLRGRAGRHGDPGDSLFVLSLEDPLLPFFSGSDSQQLMLRLGMEEGVPIESDLITNRISVAQRAEQRRNHASRLRTVELDDILDRHRMVLYRVRQKILKKQDLTREVITMLENWAARKRTAILNRGISTEWSSNTAADILGPIGSFLEAAELGRIAQVRSSRITQANMVKDYLERRVRAALVHSDTRSLILAALDQHWCRYLSSEFLAREELNLYPQWDDPALLVRHAETMEIAFDSFFYDTGEQVLAAILESQPSKSGVGAGA